MSVLERIWENTELYQLIQGYPGGIVIFDLKGEILEVNEVAAGLFSCRETDLCGKKYFDISDRVYAAKEAETLKQQAFVDGYTKLYEKKYTLMGKSVVVTQHTYLLKDANKRPLLMVAMFCPILPEKENAGAADTVRQLEKENADLKAATARPIPEDLEKAASEIEKLKSALAEAERKTVELERALVVKDKAVELKDAQLRKSEEARLTLERELSETKGALEVASIMETGVEDKEASAPTAGPLPWEEDEAAKEAPPPPKEGAGASDEKADETVDKVDETVLPRETELYADDAEPPRPEEKKADPFADAPWEADDVVYDDDVIGQTEENPENETSESGAG